MMFIFRATLANDADDDITICGDYKSLWRVFYAMLGAKFACHIDVSDGFSHFDLSRGATPTILKDGESTIIEEAKPFRVAGEKVYIPQTMTQFIPCHSVEKCLWDINHIAAVVGVPRDADDQCLQQIIDYVAARSWDEILENPVID